MRWDVRFSQAKDGISRGSRKATLRIAQETVYADIQLGYVSRLDFISTSIICHKNVANEAELSNFNKLVTIMLSAVYPKTRTRNNSVWFPLGLWYARIPV